MDDNYAQTQDILGQLPLLKSYNHVVLGFALPEGLSQDDLVGSLEIALLKITSSIPWLGSKIINVGSGPGNSGFFRSVPCAQFAPPNSILRVKDCSSLLPSYADILAAKSPVSILKGDIIAPRNAFPLSYEESESDPAPALLVQASFLKGGVLLDFCAQHNMSDGGGILQMMILLSLALQGKEFPAAAIEQATRDRRTVIPLLKPDEPMRDHSHLIRPPLPAIRPTPPSPFTWCIFRFPGPKLAKLKDQASRKEDLTVPFISKDDALCAFLWQRIASVRLQRRQTLEDRVKFTRAVDIRRTVSCPSEYMGVMVCNASSWSTFREVTTSSLGAVASTLRKSLNEIDEYMVRSFATFVSNQQDRSNIAYAGQFNPDTDLGSSSMAAVPLYKVNFGSLGQPGLIRRPSFTPVMSTIYIMPQTIAGDVDVLVCLNEQDIAALRADPDWASYAEFVG